MLLYRRSYDSNNSKSAFFYEDFVTNSASYGTKMP